MFVVYAAFGPAAEPPVIGEASTGPRGEGLAERNVEEDRYAWRRLSWREWGSASRVHPAVDVRGDAVEVWLVQVGLDELPRCALASERSSRAPASPTPDVASPVLATVGRGAWAAGEARPVRTGVQLIGDGTAIAGVRREPACGR